MALSFMRLSTPGDRKFIGGAAHPHPLNNVGQIEVPTESRIGNGLLHRNLPVHAHRTSSLVEH